jgi:hypothetical protein
MIVDSLTLLKSDMTTPSPSSSFAPLPRQEFADELRGFALLGIIFVNAPFLGISAEGFTADSVHAWYDRAAAFAVVAFAQAKFYLLFAFLFGYSMHFIVKDEGVTSVRRFRRRLLGLGLLGIAHAALLFVGDILFLYAVLGLTLTWMRRLSDRMVLRVAVFAGIAWLLLLAALPMAVMAEPGGSLTDKQWIAAGQSFNQAMREGGFFEATAARISFWPLASSTYLLAQRLGRTGGVCTRPSGWTSEPFCSTRTSQATLAGWSALGPKPWTVSRIPVGVARCRSWRSGRLLGAARNGGNSNRICRSAATQLGLCVGTRHDACRWSAGSSHLQAGGEDEPERVYRRVAHFVDCFLCLWFGPVRQTQCGSSIGAGSGYLDRAGPASEGDAISLGVGPLESLLRRFSAR